MFCWRLVGGGFQRVLANSRGELSAVGGVGVEKVGEFAKGEGVASPGVCSEAGAGLSAEGWSGCGRSGHRRGWVWVHVRVLRASTIATDSLILSLDSGRVEGAVPEPEPDPVPGHRPGMRVMHPAGVVAGRLGGGHCLVAPAGFCGGWGCWGPAVPAAGGVLSQPVQQVLVCSDPAEEVLVAADGVFVAFDPHRDVTARPSGGYPTVFVDHVADTEEPVPEGGVRPRYLGR